MATRVRVSTETVLGLIRPEVRTDDRLYVVVWNVDLANFIDRPETVFTLEEWRAKPVSVSRCHRTTVYRASDPLDAYIQALKEQMND